MRGFTLIEIMVVVVILGLLSTLVVTSVIDSGERAREAKARTDVAIVYDAVRLYRLDHGRWPQLPQLCERDGRGHRYLETLPRDPWDRDYELREVEADRCEVRSQGPDGAPGTDDDIVAPPG